VVGSTQFTWTVADTTAPTLTSPGTQSNNEGDTITPITIAASDADPGSFTAIGLPTGLSISGSGVISGNIDPRATGTYTVVVSASDGPVVGSTQFTWTVADTTAPTLTSPGTQSNNEGDTITPVTIAASDADPGSFTASGLPTGLSISDNGVISGIIDPHAAGSYNVVVNASDGAVVGQTSFTWTVTDPVPSLSAKTITPIRNQTFTGAVASFTDPDSAGDFTATINWGDGTATSNAIVQANGSGVYDVIGTHTYKTDGTYAPLVTVTDQGVTPATVSSTADVGGLAARLQVSVTTTTVTAGSPFTVTITALDGRGNRAYSYAGTVTFSSSDGQAVLPANYTFVAGDLGTHQFSGVTLKTVGNGTQSITVTDTVSAISGKQTFTVNAASAFKLVFGVQPTSGVMHGNAIKPAVKVLIEDQFGNVLKTDSTSQVTMSIATGPNGATLGGTVTVTAVKGVATFSNLILSSAGTYTLLATDGSLSVTSSSFQVVSATLDHLFMDDETLPPTYGAVWPGSDARKPEGSRGSAALPGRSAADERA
jgi:hypothetical protein